MDDHQIMSQSALEIDMQEEGKEMSSFLTNSLRAPPKKVGEVMAKLQSATVSYEDLLLLRFVRLCNAKHLDIASNLWFHPQIKQPKSSEGDLRDVLKGCLNDPLQVGRIISSLKNIEESVIYKESQQDTVTAAGPLAPGGFFKIYVSPEETVHFNKLNKALKVTSEAVSLIQKAIEHLEENRLSTLKSIDSAFNVLSQDLERRKSVLSKETNDVAQRKQNVLNEQLENLMKYQETLQSAETEYHRTLENPELHDIDRKDKNLSDIDKAINGATQYKETEPQIYPEIAFLFDDQYAEIVDKLRDFGEVIGTMKPPEIAVTDIKSYGCTVTIVPHQETADECALKLEKYEVRYEGKGASGKTELGAHETDDGNDEDEKSTLNEGDRGPDVAILEMEEDDESVSIVGLRPETEYRFSARAIYSHNIVTTHSEVIIVTTPKAKRSVFCF